MDHGLPLTRPFIAWGVGVPALYFVLLFLFRTFNLWPLPTRRGSRGSDIMAFEIVAGICVTYLAIIGCIGWFKLFPEWQND